MPLKGINLTKCDINMHAIVADHLTQSVLNTGQYINTTILAKYLGFYH